MKILKNQRSVVIKHFSYIEVITVYDYSIWLRWHI